MYTSNSAERKAMIIEFNTVVLNLNANWAKYRRFQMQIQVNPLIDPIEKAKKMAVLDSLVTKSECELQEALKLTDHYMSLVNFLDAAEGKGLTEDSIQAIINSAPPFHNNDRIWWKGKSTREALYFKEQTAILTGVPVELEVPFSANSEEEAIAYGL